MSEQLVSPENELSGKAGALKTISSGLLGMMGIAEVLTIVIKILNPSYPAIPMTMVLVGVMLISSITYWLARTGRVRSAGYIFILGLTLESAIITPMFGGFIGPRYWS